MLLMTGRTLLQRDVEMMFLQFTIGSLGRQAPFKNQDERTRSSYIEIVMSCDHNISNS